MWVDVGVYGLPRAVHEQKPFDMRSAMRGSRRTCAGWAASRCTPTSSPRATSSIMFEHEAYRELRGK